jgi:hypothetical protein
VAGGSVGLGAAAGLPGPAGGGRDAGRPLRAVQIAAAAGLSTDKAKVEGLRSKLKRLVERGWMAEDAGPGLFTLPARDGTRGSGKTGVIAGSSS